MSTSVRFLCALSLALAAACGPSATADDDDDNGSRDGGDECAATCPDDQVCVPGIGCTDCWPGQTYCSGANDDEVWQCNDDGTGGEFVERCDSRDVCHNGFCLTPCERSDMIPSNVGCHFYAVDLDNEAVTGIIDNDAQAQQFAIAVANVNVYETRVDVYKNTARVGDPVAEELVASVTVQPMDLE